MSKSKKLSSNKSSSNHKRNEDSKFYSLSQIEKCKGIYNVIIDKRSNGKTYACLEKVIREFEETGTGLVGHYHEFSSILTEYKDF